MSIFSPTPAPIAKAAEQPSVSLTKLDFARPEARDVRAHAVSANGSVIVGDFWDVATGRREAFRWAATTGMVALGFIGAGGPKASSTARGVSADGAIVVGRAHGFEAAYAARFLEAAVPMQFGAWRVQPSP